MRRSRRNDWLMGELPLVTNERLKSECRKSPPLNVDPVWRRASGDGREARTKTTGNFAESRLEWDASASSVAAVKSWL